MTDKGHLALEDKYERAAEDQRRAETIARLEAIAAGNLTQEDLREASDLALLAKGWERRVYEKWGFVDWVSPEGTVFAGMNRPNPAGNVDDAVRWMVPEGYGWAVNWDTEVGGSAPIARANLINLQTRKRPVYPIGACNPALALTIASLKVEQ